MEDVELMNPGGEEAEPGLAGDDAFEPTEDELVLHFLRPQLRGLAPRVAGAVAEADPCDAAPWELVARHGRGRGRGGDRHGYLFAARDRRSSASAVRRSVPGVGSWLRVPSSTRTGRSVSALGGVAHWSAATFLFCFTTKGRAAPMRSSSWVMAEYEITDPGCYRRAGDGEAAEYWVLCHIREGTRFHGSTPRRRPWYCVTPYDRLWLLTELARREREEEAKAQPTSA